MATTSDSPKSLALPAELHSGDRYSREEFHRIYSEMPEDFKAELIGGIVYLASPRKLPHGTSHLPLGTLFFTYEAKTPGVQCADNTTILLGEDCEPQPDLLLRILPEHGGQSDTTEDEYISGPPELVAEIAHSSHAMDLHAKRADYQRYGVKEYLVLSVRDRRLYWFDLYNNRERKAEADGIVKLTSFPGLWIHATALLSKDHAKMIAVLEQGLASAEHAEFVDSLAKAKQ